METLLRDVKHALRMFRESGVSFVVTAVLALGLGIGANTAIFSLVNTVLLKAPPFPAAERIVILGTRAPQGENNAASPAKFAYWAQQSDVLEDVAALNEGLINWTSAELPVQLREERVSSKYFSLFGVPMVMGRGFNAEEDAPKGVNAVVISEGLWSRRFGRDPSVIGKTMLLGGDPYNIVGVASQKFDFRDFGPAPEVWIPFQLDPNSPDQGHYFQAAARMKNGLTLERVAGAVKGNIARVFGEIPKLSGAGRGIHGGCAARFFSGQFQNLHLYSDGRSRICFADCLFKCGESAAGAGRIKKARTGDSRGVRGWTPSHDSTVTNRELTVIGGWSDLRGIARISGYSRTAFDKHRGTTPSWNGWRVSALGCTGIALHVGVNAVNNNLVRPVPRPASNAH